MVFLFKPYRYTRGFPSYGKFSDHFQKHGARLGLRTELQYARWIDRFCGGPTDADTDECMRLHDNSILRFHNATGVFGVLHIDGRIGTCFRPKRGRYYFDEECKR